MATVVLTVVGGIIGGPLGASIGTFVGSMIDQSLFGPKITNEGPRLNDLTVQASSYGQPIPRVFGSENRIAGNVIWSTGLVETSTTQKQGGKGGGGSSDTSQHRKGEAADIEIDGVPNFDLAELIRRSLPFDQLILESYVRGVANSGWVHVSYCEGRLRGSALTMTIASHGAVYSNGLLA